MLKDQITTSEPEAKILTDTLIYELTKAMALPQTANVKRMIQFMFGRAAKHFATLGMELDCVVAEQGIAAGARWVLPRFVKDHSACGIKNIPMQGPLVIAANHPGSYDSLVISAHVTRPDYKIIIGDIPFFEHLPHVSEHAIYAPNDRDIAGRMQVVRQAIRHLKNDGALLIFARGGIEADPAFMPNADGEFNQWSRSLEIFLRSIPHLQVLITLVSGVISEIAMRHPITWFRKKRPDRQRLAFMYQMIRQMLSGREIFGLSPHVTFGDLISSTDTNSREHVLQSIAQSARKLLPAHISKL
ncbi:MAG: 1-acyl-sn-glycerol-3-phosphate acyltransferase [Anaerolineae bacterium]|nr:1-acyl-sn-glycerol-3-phosphate acyltransferase [Anaerolineae bacterium]MCI0611229.1 1-acyl-sn-glycerol-3-phosphate acyltransferase [Anaerolineae bacterium]